MLGALLTFPNAKAQHATGLLWKISKTGMPDSYLFGTMHLLCEDDFAMSPKLQSIIQSTKTICFEVDLNDHAEMASAMQYMQMNGDTTIEQLLGPERFRVADSCFQALTSMPLSMVNKLQPMLAISAIYPAFTGCAMDGVESKLMQFARDNGLRSSGLETIAEQAAILSKMPYNVQAEMLWKALENIDSSKISFQQMRAAYKSGNLERIEQLTNTDENFSAYESDFLSQRNISWITKIESLLHQGPTFIAVGAAHLPGEKGLIQLLRTEGYHLTSVHLDSY